MTDSTLSTRYDPKLVEQKWYSEWESENLFAPRPARNAAPYCITIPPPNVTGSLHMGHALCYSVQDVLGRWKRMQGFEVLVLPGMDHAGIATHKVVESQLKQEGLSRFDLGREAFMKRVWEWKEQSGGTILQQFKRLGFAFDWSRERFTMDPAYHRAVLHVFIDWYKRGLIYRGKRVINWDPGLRTSVSDIEMFDETRRGKLYYFRYPFEDGSGHVVIATTRPETMLADVAVAVHPTDGRYRGLVGKAITLPLVNRTIPLIADEYPDPTYGTGAVKITPAHDVNDFEVGVRMGLDFNDPNQVPVCLDEAAKVVAPGTSYHGLDRYEARKRIVEDLDALGLIEKIEDCDIALKISDRSGQIIEPLLSEQWFCSMKPLAQPAIDAVRSGEIRFIPQRYGDVYLRWMEEIKDWCLSRQLWWGHRIPVYYTKDGRPFAALSEQEAEELAGEPVTQDPDVLDTWFSSALWPFATLGWPDSTPDLEKFYPTDVLITARDIIYLWVARMTMDGLDLLKQRPFKDVYIYATVLTEDGKRMSKSLGTGIDPIEYIDRFGADAMRFSLLVQTGHNQDIRFGEKRIEEARNFCNKIWNASRFALLNLESEPPAVSASEVLLEDRWILSRLTACGRAVLQGLQNYNMMDSCSALQEFFWSEFCDWYIEIAKSRLQSEDTRQTPASICLQVLHAFCHYAHPFMPHITEEVWHRLPGTSANAFLDYSQWPILDRDDTEAEAEMKSVMTAVRNIRTLRQTAGITPGKRIERLYYIGKLVNPEIVCSQSWFGELVDGRPDGPALSAVGDGIEIFLPLAAIDEPEKHVARLLKEEQHAHDELMALRRRLENPQFVQRAKPDIVERGQREARGLEEKIALLAAHRVEIEGFVTRKLP